MSVLNRMVVPWHTGTVLLQPPTSPYSVALQHWMFQKPRLLDANLFEGFLRLEEV